MALTQFQFFFMHLQLNANIFFLQENPRGQGHVQHAAGWRRGARARFAKYSNIQSCAKNSHPHTHTYRLPWPYLTLVNAYVLYRVYTTGYVGSEMGLTRTDMGNGRCRDPDPDLCSCITVFQFRNVGIRETLIFFDFLAVPCNKSCKWNHFLVVCVF